MTFLRTGTRLTPDGSREYIFQAPVKIKTHLSDVAAIIAQAKQAENGYSQKRLSKALMVEACWAKAPAPSLPEAAPFAGEPLLPPLPIIPFTNLTIFDQPNWRSAPYGIFPFDDRTCFELMSGEILLKVTLHLGHLQQQYRHYGLSFQPPALSQEDVNAYYAASRGEQKRLLEDITFNIGDAPHVIAFSLAHFSPLFVECFQEEAFVEADRQMFNFLRQFHSSGKVGVNSAYTGEDEIWR